LTLRICHVDFIMLYQCKLLSLQHYILLLCIFQWYVSLELPSYLIEIIFALHIYMKMIKALGILTTWGQKINLKHIILNEPLLSLFIFSLLYPCASLNFLYVFLFPWPRISRAYTCDISWNYGWKLREKKEEVMLDEKMGKVANGEKQKEKKRKKKVFLYVLKILCWKSLKSK